MEAINKKITVFLDALGTLEEGIELFYKYESLFDKNPTDENGQLFRSMRDSLIQRFEYCTDLFWKVVKLYLEDVEKLDVPVNAPRTIVREAVKARILSDIEGDECMDMVDARNKTSHTYHEVMADEIAHVTPGYYEFMQKIIERLQTLLAN